MDNEIIPALLQVPENLPTKKELPQYTRKLVTDLIESGNFDMAEVYAKLKFINSVTDAAMKVSELQSSVLEAIEMSNDNEARYFGQMTLHKSSTGDKYDYSHDLRWQGLQEDLDTANAEVKRVKDLVTDREAFLLQVTKNPEDTFDGDGTLLEKSPLKTAGRAFVVTKF